MEVISDKIRAAYKGLKLNKNMPLASRIIAAQTCISEYPGMSSIMGTNGKEIFVNSDRLDPSLTVKQIMTIFVHETMHILYNHIYRSRSLNGMLYNIAADYFDNSLIAEDPNLDLPEGALLDARYTYKTFNSVEDLYRFLQRNQNEENSKKSNNEQTKSEDKTDSFGQAKTRDVDRENQGDIRDSEEEQPESHSKYGNHNNWKELNQKEIEEVDRKIQSAIETVSQMCGSHSSIIDRKIQELKIEPKVNWKREIKIFPQSLAGEKEKTWKRPNRRCLAMDLYLPKKVSTVKKPHVLFFIDTSGSISDRLAAEFLEEAKFSYTYSHITLGCFDTRVYNVKKVENKEDLEKYKVIGGGGTDFNEIFKWIEIQPNTYDGLIILTDGYSSLDMKYKKIINKVLWVSNGSTDSLCFGKVLKI